MTKKLFWDDPYLTECDAKVTFLVGKQVRLDQTIFYAFSGGQLSDEGTIGGIQVVEAVKEGDKENIIDITYILEQEPSFNVGDTVTVAIDRERRAKLRKLHSAIHIVYYMVIEMLGKININGSEVQPEKARMDFGYDGPITEKIPLLEKAVNEFIAQNHPIERTTELKKPDLRWWICGTWKMPCGGTHVRNTSEIGPITLRRVNKGKGRERIEVYLQ